MMTKTKGVIKRAVSYAFARPQFSYLAGRLVTAYLEVRFGHRVEVAYKHGTWRYAYPDVTIVDHRLRLMKQSQQEWLDLQRDTWLYLYQPKPGDVILNIGAGKGDETYCFSKVVGPTGKVVAVEAHPQTFELLQQFCLINRLDNVILLNAAIQGSDSDAHITDDDQDIANTIVGVQRGVKVRGLSIDQLVTAFNLPLIDYIKMNIEGAEKLAVAGMKESAAKTRYMCISCHDFLAERNGIESMRTKSCVRDFLEANHFTIKTREDCRPWISDQLNAINQRFANHL